MMLPRPTPYGVAAGKHSAGLSVLTGAPVPAIAEEAIGMSVTEWD